MDIAHRQGRSRTRRSLTNIEERRPLVKDEDVVAFGFRDVDEQAASRKPATSPREFWH